ncbi:5-formyltetrahydrofolate cyclo-ligase [Planococcus lenghuensis]|uniref:5-formyltetrahydrofolate cyclo-ligase n=1 Tax=Planococcus lenghuensis TaxID=2213202 RepID=A0A1Q2KXS9_9BACL|nr:5-formyltetrahydrofolate cyclo-ligase [Planococcus lenghuensis]AQQ52999.1 5-formyltetrahydrofolate cyclo-ligase [Planococcus lenghuensis]
MDKATLRKKMLQQLKELDPEMRSIKTEQITERLLTDPVFRAAGSIGITVAGFPEIDTAPIIRQAWASGKRVAAPKCHPASRKMDFYVFSHMNELETVYMDLKEPNPAVTRWLPPDDIDLLIVPGIVFSRSGYRIGFGGGYYDRFLAGYANPTVSLAFDFQLSDNFPAESHDIPVSMIYTENQLIRTEAFR